MRSLNLTCFGAVQGRDFTGKNGKIPRTEKHTGAVTKKTSESRMTICLRIWTNTSISRLLDVTVRTRAHLLRAMLVRTRRRVRDRPRLRVRARSRLRACPRRQVHARNRTREHLSPCR